MRKSALKRRLHDWAWAFTRAHAPDGEGADDKFVAELQEVTGAVAQEGDDHVPGNPKFVGVLGAEEATEVPSEAGVGCRPGDGRWKVAVARRGASRSVLGMEKQRDRLRSELP